MKVDINDYLVCDNFKYCKKDFDLMIIKRLEDFDTSKIAE